MREAAASGRPLVGIHHQATQSQREARSCGRSLLGVNRSIATAEPQTRTGVHRADEEALREDPSGVKELARTSDNSEVREAGENLRKTAERKEENLFSVMLEAAKGYATSGEMMGAIRLAYGYPYDPYKILEYPFA
jgi:methylmalonyl-CoA mutase N-terminal domain/subunit